MDRVVSSLIVAASLFSGFPAGAFSIGAAPAIIKAEIPPGVSAEQKVTITNANDGPLTFQASVRDIALDTAGNQARFPPGTQPRSMAGWVTLHPEQFTVPARGQATVAVVISVPADASGGHQAALVFQTVTEMPGTEGLGMGIGAALAVTLHHATSGRMNQNLEVTGIKLVPPTEHERLSMTLRVLNTGDVFVRATAEMIILDAKKNLAGRAEAKPTSILIPGQAAQIDIDWGGSLAPGAYKTIITILYGHDGSVVVDRSFTVK